MEKANAPTTGNASMKYLSIIILLAINLGVAQGNAQKLDFSEISCASFLKFDKDTTKMIVTWYLGFYTGEKDPQIVDVPALDDLQVKLTEFCKLEPAFRISTAAEGILGR
jgi:hypothetical protein